MSNLLVALPLSQRRPLRICTDVPLLMKYSSSSPTNRSATPSAITPSMNSRQCFFHVLCMHDFESSDPVHFPFKRDEVLTIIQQERSGWWAAMRPHGDRIGWIPSSFVLPLDKRKIAEYPDETPWPYGSSNDYPPSAVHDPWVPVSDDYKYLSFKVLTPSDHALHKGFFDDRVQNHNHEPFFHLSNGELCVDIGYMCLPVPDSPSVHTSQSLPLPPSPLSSELGALQLARPASLSPLRAESHYHSRPYAVDDEIPFLCSTTLVGSDPSAPEVISSMDVAESLAVFKLVATSQDNSCIEGALSRPLGLPVDLCLAAP